MTIDVDSKTDQWNEVREFLAARSIVPVATIETHGGYHVLITAKDAGVNRVAEYFKGRIMVDDLFCPVPGTLQAGWPVRFV